MTDVFNHFQKDMVTSETCWRMRNECFMERTGLISNRPDYDLTYGATYAQVRDVPGSVRHPRPHNWDLHTIGNGRLQDGHASGRLATCVDYAIGDIVNRRYCEPQGHSPPKMVYRMKFVCRLRYPNDRRMCVLNHRIISSSSHPDRLEFTRARVRREFHEDHHLHHHPHVEHMCAVVAYQRDRAHRLLGISQPPQWDPIKANSDWDPI